ncbi:MAG: ATP-binding cassette domain-containing protein [Woeseiaceae bacterium]|nr:ATP-binding cassette domain-containing protein [Woeseiaceae bacterium]
MNSLIAEQVTLRIAGKRLFAPLDIEVDPGTVVSVTGPSGSGKSSLLGFLSGTLPEAIEAAGTVRVGEEDLTGLPPETRGLGLLVQDALLFPHLSVAGNLLFGMRPGGGAAARRRRADEALQSLGLDGFGDRDPATLSGGQKTRVALLRVLLSEPRALLLDEPFGALDVKARARAREAVFATVRRRGLPALLVTHDEQDVVAAGGPVVELELPETVPGRSIRRFDMLDATQRPVIDKPLNAAGRWLAARGVRADIVTATGLVAGLLAALAVALQLFAAAFVLVLCNRLLDGLDGAVARASVATDRGGYLDIVVDYVFYGSIPLAFAIADPARNAVPAAALLAGFCLTAASFLAFAVIAAKRGLETDAQGRKSFFYSRGLIEGTETILLFLLVTAMPHWFPVLAWLFAFLCVLTAVQRSALAITVFR